MKTLTHLSAARRLVGFSFACVAVILENCLPLTAAAADLPVPPPVLPPIPAVGSQYSAVPAPLPSVQLVGSQGPFIGLKIDDAIGMALAQNTDLQLSESSRRVSGYQIVADRGPFDLRFTVAPSFSESTQPAVSPFEAGPNGGPTTNLTTGLSSGLAVTTLEGGQISLQASAQRMASNSTANAYNPYFQTSIALQMNQPLGTGRYSKDRRDLNLAIISAQSQEASTFVSASTTMTNVIDAYWDLVAAWRSLGIQEEALAQAQTQTRSNNRLVRRGSAAPVDVIESNTQVDVDQDNVFSALQNVATIENRLKGFILSNPADPLWQANIVPTSPVAEVPPEPQLESLIVTGLIQRPEFISIAAARKSADIQLAFARDEAKPQIDLQLNASEAGFAGQNGNLNANPIFGALDPFYTSINGLIANANAAMGPGGTPLQPITPLAFTNPPNTVGRLGQSWNSLFNSTYPTVSAQVNIGFPLKNDRARGDFAIARETARQAQIQEAQTIERLIADARNALQQFDADRQRLNSAHAARVAADDVLESEKRKFQVGRSTTFLVLQRQIEAANDQGRELQAQTDLNKAIAELDRVSGAVFAKHGIHLRLPSLAAVDERFRLAGFVASGKPGNVVPKASGGDAIPQPVNTAPPPASAGNPNATSGAQSSQTRALESPGSASSATSTNSTNAASAAPAQSNQSTGSSSSSQKANAALGDGNATGAGGNRASGTSGSNASGASGSNTSGASAGSAAGATGGSGAGSTGTNSGVTSGGGNTTGGSTGH